MRQLLLFLIAAPLLAAQIRVNAGGGVSGAYGADQYFTGGAAYTATVAVPAGLPDYLKTSRAGNFSYRFPVSDGSYTVVLHFVENSSAITAAGQRSFSVAINGSSVIPSLDLFAVAGINVEVVKTFPATAAGNGISIAFTTIVRNAVVSAIEVLPVPTSPVVGFRPTQGLGGTFKISASAIACYVNGIRQYQGTDYVYDGTTVTPNAGTLMADAAGALICDYTPK